MLDDDHPGARAVAARMARAAGDRLDLLDPAQRPAATGATPGEDDTERGGNHAHSVWRDPDADFGVDVLAAHRAAESNHTRSAGEPGGLRGRRSGYDEAR